MLARLNKTVLKFAVLMVRLSLVVLSGTGLCKAVSIGADVCRVILAVKKTYDENLEDQRALGYEEANFDGAATTARPVDADSGLAIG